MPGPLIAVVHDDPTILLVLRELLADAGYQTRVWEAARGVSAEIDQVQPALVILDIQLEQPEAGWVLLNDLRQNPATAAIPVLVCTADGRFVSQRAAEVRALGAELVPVPFDLDDLLARIEAALRRAAARPSQAP